MYEYLSHEITQNKIIDSRFMIDLLSGALSGSIAAIITHPFDVVKTRLQIETLQRQRSILRIIRNMMQKEGYMTLFNGLLPRLARVSPACAVMISTYELGKFYLEA